MAVSNFDQSLIFDRLDMNAYNDESLDNNAVCFVKLMC